MEARHAAAAVMAGDNYAGDRVAKPALAVVTQRF